MFTAALASAPFPRKQATLIPRLQLINPRRLLKFAKWKATTSLIRSPLYGNFGKYVDNYEVYNTSYTNYEALHSRDRALLL